MERGVLEMPVKLLADSGSDLPLQFLKENNIKLFPLKVLLKEQEYEDLITIEPKTIYTAIRNGEVPKTSQVSPALFEKTFTEMAENNEEGVYLSFFISVIRYLSNSCDDA